MYINFWYVAGRSEDFADQPVRRRMLGQDFVLFRDSQGIARCLANTCTHRGGSLGNGKIKGDCIQCPYHGWQFNGDGECTRIPSLGANARIPARTRVDAYPTTEKYGLVFAFSAVYLPTTGNNCCTQYSIVVTFVLLALVLAIRPQGLFGREA